MHVWSVILQASAKGTLAEGDIVELTARTHALEDAFGLVWVDACGHAIGARCLEPEDEVIPTGGADGSHQLAHEARAAF